jgi:hypothetical protein
MGEERGSKIGQKTVTYYLSDTYEYKGLDWFFSLKYCIILKNLQKTGKVPYTHELIFQKQFTYNFMNHLFDFFQ